MKLADSTGQVNYTIPVSNGVLRPPHVERIGPALALFILLEDLVTDGTGSNGKVLGGRPVKDGELGERLGLHPKTIATQRRRLTKHGYIECIRTGRGYILFVRKSKKWASLQQSRGSEYAPSNKTKEALQVHRTAAASKETVWNFLKIDPCGPNTFRQLLENHWTRRNGGHYSKLLGEAVDAWEAANGTKPPYAAKFFVALEDLRARERQQPTPTAGPIHTLSPEEIPA